MKIFILVLFILTYVLIIALPKYKVYVTGAAAVLAAGGIMIEGLASFGEIFGAADAERIFHQADLQGENDRGLRLSDGSNL